MCAASNGIPEALEECGLGFPVVIFLAGPAFRGCHGDRSTDWSTQPSGTSLADIEQVIGPAVPRLLAASLGCSSTSPIFARQRRCYRRRAAVHYKPCRSSTSPL